MNYLSKISDLTMTLSALVIVFTVHSVEADQMVELNSNQSILGVVTEKNKSGFSWFNYQVKMEPNNGMPCCYLRKGEHGCSLSQRRNYWASSRVTTRQDSKLLDIYFKSGKGQVEDLFIAGSECPVEKDGLSVTNINNVSQKQTLTFLKQIMTHSSKQSSHASSVTGEAIAAIAHHEGELAHQLLVEVANQDNYSLVENAIFWLGRTRNKAGFQSLLKILDNPQQSSEKKKHAVFALSVNNFEGSRKKLLALARVSADEFIRSEAIFWIAQNNLPQALDVIKEVLTNRNSPTVNNKAVFALSQLKSDEAWSELTKIATHHRVLEVQKQAVFWLSQNDQRDPLDLLMRIALGRSPQVIREQAVFAISQLKRDNATKGLVKLLQTTDERYIKQKAIFWLGQSNDDKAIQYIESLILASK